MGYRSIVLGSPPISERKATSAKPGKALWLYGSCIVLKRTEVTMGCLCRSVWPIDTHRHLEKQVLLMKNSNGMCIFERSKGAGPS